MSLLESIRDQASQLIEEARQSVAMNALAARKGINEFGVLLLGDFMKLAQEVGGTNEEKKAAVMELAALFYDKVIEPIDLPGPDAIFDPLLRAGWLKFADFAVDGLFSLFNSTTVLEVVASFQKPAQ